MAPALELHLAGHQARDLIAGLNEMVSLTEKPCRLTPAGLSRFRAEDLS